jgi:flavin reductase (DIM6/NTAB) family NADH-FMN oxidoreductase RutF
VIRKQPVGPSRYEQQPQRRPRSRSLDVAIRPMKSVDQDDSWLHLEVLTSMEKPFDTLAPWEEVLRYKSSAGIMLQLSLPEQAMAWVKGRFGERLESVRGTFGADAELGQTAVVKSQDGSPTHVQSVLISGDPLKASKFRQVLLAQRQAVKNLKADSRAAPSPLDAWRDQSERQARFEPSKGNAGWDGQPSPPRSTPSATPPKQLSPWQGDPIRRLKFDANAVLISETHLPSKDINPYEWAIRERVGEFVSRFEVAIPVNIYHIISERFKIIGKWKKGNILIGTNMFPEHGTVCLMFRANANNFRPSIDSLETVLAWIRTGHYPGAHGIKSMPDEQNADVAKPTRSGTSPESTKPTPVLPQARPFIDPGNEPPAVAESMKSIFRRLSHPVALVLASHKIPTSKSGWYERADKCLNAMHGATVSSLTTVSLSPYPVISFNLKLSSRTWEAIQDSASFKIQLLHASPAAAGLADLFTQAHSHPASVFRRFIADQRKGDPPSTQTSNLLEPENFGVRLHLYLTRREVRPQFIGSPILATLVAELDSEKCVTVGDHVVVIARVKAVHSRAQSSSEGLAYSMRGYRGAGLKIQPLPAPSTTPDDHDAQEVQSVDLVDEGPETEKSHLLDDLRDNELEERQADAGNITTVDEGDPLDAKSGGAGDHVEEANVSTEPTSAKVEEISDEISKDIVSPPIDGHENDVLETQERDELAVLESMSRYDDDVVAQPAPSADASKAKTDIPLSDGGDTMVIEHDAEITEDEAELERFVREEQKKHDEEMAKKAQEEVRRVPPKSKESFANEDPDEREKRGPTGAWGM